MPFVTSWIPRDLFLDYKGIKIYHTYKDNDYEHELSEWYSLYENDGEEDFDIRDLPNYNRDTDYTEILKYAIDKGYFNNGTPSFN